MKPPSKTPATALVVTEISESQYHVNLVKMCVIWTMTIFSQYLIMFQLKYLNGNIFDNTSSFAISDAASRIFGGYVYSNYGVKNSFISAYLIAIAGATGIYMV
jgi:hypothetical protein